MARNNNGYRFQVDNILSHLTTEDRLEFDEYCWSRPTYTAIKTRLDDLRREYADNGISLPYVSQKSVDTWYKHTYPPAEQAAAINQLSREFDGLDGDGLMRYAAGVIVQFLEPMREVTRSTDFLESLKGETAIHQFMLGLKEVRTIGATLKAREVEATKRAVERSGAYRLAEVVRQLIKDQRFETEITDLLTAALIQHDSET